MTTTTVLKRPPRAIPDPTTDQPPADSVRELAVELLEWEAATSAAILELMCQINASPDSTAACLTLVNLVRARAGCDRVAVGLCGGRENSCRLQAVAGAADIDLRGALAVQIEAALNESLLRGNQAVLPSFAAHEDPAITATADSAAQSGIITAPLHAADGSILGAWLFQGSADWVCADRTRRFIEAATEPIAVALRSVQRSEPALWQRPLRLLGRAFPLLHGKKFWLTIAVVVACGFVPWPYQVKSSCELQPVVRRFVAAPHLGVFEKSFVEPGDLVTPGQLLGRMDGREIEWELAGLAAENSRVSKDRDVNMATSKVAAAQMNALDLEKLEQRRRLLQNRAENLDIKSPLGGVVIAGDLQRSAGVPLAVGQTLYEIAPIDQMVCELWIPADDWPHVYQGQVVTMEFESFPGRRWDGELKRIHPRSEIRGEKNVFLGEVAVANTDQLLRPGVKGRAWIKSAPHPIGWNLFHKPWQLLVEWTGW